MENTDDKSEPKTPELVDKVTREEFKQYMDLVQLREQKKSQYGKIPTALIGYITGTKAVMKVHWTFAILGLTGVGHEIYKGIQARKECKKLDQKIKEFEGKFFDEPQEY